MKLKCTIGSISCNGVLAESGDVFEIDDERGEHLIKHRNATEVVPDKPPVVEKTGKAPTVKMTDEPIKKAISKPEK